MKKTLLCAAIAFAACFAFSLDTANFVPNGDVSSYTKTDYSVTSKFGQYYRSVTSRHVHEYNDQGLKVSTSEYSVKDVLLDKIDYQYDDSGKLSSLEFYGPSGTVVWKTAYEYDAEGALKSESEYDAEGTLVGKTIYEYASGKTTESYYNGYGSLLERTFTLRDEDGKTTGVDRYYGDGTLENREVYTYLDDGRLSKVEYLDALDNLNERKVYVYDATTSFLSEIQTFNASGVVLERQQYKNDEKGNPTRVNVWKVFFKFGTTVNELQSITEYSYKYL